MQIVLPPETDQQNQTINHKYSYFKRERTAKFLFRNESNLLGFQFRSRDYLFHALDYCVCLLGKIASVSVCNAMQSKCPT